MKGHTSHLPSWVDYRDRGSRLLPMTEPEHGGRLIEAPNPVAWREPDRERVMDAQRHRWDGRRAADRSAVYFAVRFMAGWLR